jgi:hypothetical protein
MGGDGTGIRTRGEDRTLRSHPQIAPVVVRRENAPSAPFASARVMRRHERDVQQLGRLPLRPLSPAVVTAGGRAVGVAGQALGGDQIAGTVEQVRDERAPKVMRRKRCDSCVGRDSAVSQAPRLASRTASSATADRPACHRRVRRRAAEGRLRDLSSMDSSATALITNRLSLVRHSGPECKGPSLKGSLRRLMDQWWRQVDT